VLKALSAALAMGLVLSVAPPALSKEAAPAKIVKSTKGKVYADHKGMTLYVFDKDGKGKSNCAGMCATYWPPLAAAATAKPSGEWSIVARDDGSRQWAYEGKPLYTYADDHKPGDVTGDGVDGTWHLAKP